MDELIVKKILGVDINVLTNTKEEKTISLFDLLNNENSTMCFDYDDFRKPYCKIDIHLECDGYNWIIK